MFIFLHLDSLWLYCIADIYNWFECFEQLRRTFMSKLTSSVFNVVLQTCQSMASIAIPTTATSTVSETSTTF